MLLVRAHPSVRPGGLPGPPLPPGSSVELSFNYLPDSLASAAKEKKAPLRLAEKRGRNRRSKSPPPGSNSPPAAYPPVLRLIYPGHFIRYSFFLQDTLQDKQRMCQAFPGGLISQDLFIFQLVTSDIQIIRQALECYPRKANVSAEVTSRPGRFENRTESRV